MKNVLTSCKMSIAAALLFALSLSSCTKEKTETIDPQIRMPFVGTYQVKDQNKDENSYYSFQLYVSESDKGPDKIKLENFRYVNSPIVATVKGNGFAIDETLQGGSETLTIKGNGTLSDKVLTYSYTLVYKKTGKADRVFVNTAQATKK